MPVESSDGQKVWSELTEVSPKDFLKWKDKHLKTIEMNYKRAPYFGEFINLYGRVLMEDHKNLADLNISIMDMMMEWFRLDRKVYRSSEMGIDMRSEARVIEICNRLGADQYISGTGGKNYQDPEHFSAAGLKLTYAEYIPVAYRSSGMALENEHVSIDFAMNCGHEIDRYFSRCKKKEEAFREVGCHG